ncbi:MAG: KOW motif-containing protein [Bacilli bacterium]|jgi:transcriptional antiterminator NusG|nr:KOW motif-containing protein [Bacilli bacterium]
MNDNETENKDVVTPTAAPTEAKPATVDPNATSVEKALPEHHHTYNPLIGEVNPGEDNDENDALPEKAWYVINTFALRERQVKDMLEKRAKSMNMEDKIFRVICAEYEDPVKDPETGKPKMVKDKTTGQMVPKFKTKNYYPGYIFVEMIMTDETWFVVRNTPGVSGITGSSGKGAKPFPIPREEIEPVLKRMHIEDPDMYSDYKVGDRVKILSGTFADAEGEIEEVNAKDSEVTLDITLFGRPQRITSKFSEIEKATDDNSENPM